MREVCDPVRLDSLQRIVHRIAGSAASYGYDEIGTLAARADEGLESLSELGVVNARCRVDHGRPV